MRFSTFIWADWSAWIRRRAGSSEVNGYSLIDSCGAEVELCTCDGSVMIAQDVIEGNRNVYNNSISNQDPGLRADTALECQGEPDI